MRRVTVRNLTVQEPKGHFVVAGAVSAEAGQPGTPAEWLDTALRELVPGDLELVGE
jgi:hypothetical protein